jgi:palmitoyltransferase
MNFSMVVKIMIDELRIRLGIDSIKEIKTWVNEKTAEGHSALHYAAYKGNIEIINKLIENGADPEISNNSGLNVLHMAAQGNQPNALIYFFKKYSLDIHSVDDKGSTPLHWACYSGSEVYVQFLLSLNANVNARDRDGLTSLHLAVNSGK